MNILWSRVERRGVRGEIIKATLGELGAVAFNLLMRFKTEDKQKERAATSFKCHVVSILRCCLCALFMHKRLLQIV